MRTKKYFVEKNGDGKFVGTGKWLLIDEYRIQSRRFSTRKAAREFIKKMGYTEIPPVSTKDAIKARDAQLK